MIPRTLAENAGLNAMEIISSLYAEHAADKAKVGIDLENGVCNDVAEMKIWDLYVTKWVLYSKLLLSYYVLFPKENCEENITC